MNTVIFDLDGTLVHSAPDLHAAANRMLAELGKQPQALETVTSFIGNGVPMLVRRCLNTADANDIDHEYALALFRTYYLEEPTTFSTLYPGVMDLLSDLKSQGCSLGICTNKSGVMTDRVLKGLRIHSFFDCVISGDSLETRKPDPEPLLAVLDTLRADIEESLYVGDSEVDAETAQAAEVDFALFLDGYRELPADELPHCYSFSDYGLLHSFIHTRREVA